MLSSRPEGIRVITRRNFLHRSCLATTAWVMNRFDGLSQSTPVKPNTLDPNELAKFVDPLPIPPIAQPLRYESLPDNPKVKLAYYRVSLKQIQVQVYRDLKPTTFWGCGSSLPGLTFETRSGGGLLVEWVNELPAKHFLPIDHRIHGAQPDKPEARAVIHLHGAKAPPESDGYPENWIVPGQSALYHYPNQQDAAMLWYHDHTMGINRLNIYAGLFGLFFIRDAVEDSLDLPSGKYEIPLVIFDRMLTPAGQLFYPVSGKADAPWVPELFADAFLVNGKLFPYLDVAPRKYRFRVLNASNARFYHLSLGDGATFWQIGTDQGLLPAPVSVKALMIAPAERVDFIVDFGGRAGEDLILKSESFEIMQFRVLREKGNDTGSLPTALRPFKPIPESQAIKTRRLTLDQYVNLVNEPVLMLLNASYWHQPVTEKPILNTTEIWTFINPTDDSHPIHLHLVRFQILDRRPYDPWTYQTTGQLKFTGPPVPPEPSEAGWKDTVRAHPKMVTRIIVPFEGFTGRYVWHCHILEHEDNEMMRPYEVIAP
jgi:spore coat protein A, manganese oxidase